MAQKQNSFNYSRQSSNQSSTASELFSIDLCLARGFGSVTFNCPGTSPLPLLIATVAVVIGKI